MSSVGLKGNGQMWSTELLVLKQSIEPTSLQLLIPPELCAFQKARPSPLLHPSGPHMPASAESEPRALRGHFCLCDHLGIRGIHITYPLIFSSLPLVAALLGQKIIIWLRQ